MYKSVLKYKATESANINTDIIAFSASDIITPELIIKNIFVTNNNDSEQKFNCYILKTSDNSKFYLVANGEPIQNNGSYSVINKPIYLNSDDQIIFNGSAVNMDISLCITYDAGV